jgi:hypothetical protein
MLSACSLVRLAYEQAPTLAYWWLDSYADFNDAQAPQVHAAIDRWFAWKRRTQLPAYADWLARLQTEMLADTTPERVCAQWSEVRQRLEPLFEQALPDLAEIAAGLTPQQLQHIARKLETSNQSFREEYVDSDLLRRQQAALKRTRDRAETLYGTLNTAQVELLRRGLARSTFDPEAWAIERKLSQQEALQRLTTLAASKPDRQAAQAVVRELWQRMLRSPREDYRRYAERLTQSNCALYAELHNATTGVQRQAAARKLQGWEGDLRALAAPPS